MPSIHCHPSIRRSHRLQTLSRGHQERTMSHLASLSPQFLMGFSCKHVSYRSLMSKKFEQKTHWAHPVFCLPMGRLPLCQCPNPRLLNRGHKSRPLQPLTSNRWSAGWRENWKCSWAKLISSSKIGSVKIWPFTDMNWDLNRTWMKFFSEVCTLMGGLLWPELVQEKSQLQEDASKLAAGSAGRQANLKVWSEFLYSVQKATFGNMGCRPRARSVTAISFGPARGSFDQGAV